MIPRNLKELQKFEGQIIKNSRSEAGNWLQPRLLNINKGHAEISVIVRKEMCNPFGNIHGGMMSLIVDECIGWSVISLESNSFYTSISLNLNFLYAATVGENIRAMAKIVRHGKKIINAEVSV